MTTFDTPSDERSPSPLSSPFPLPHHQDIWMTTLGWAPSDRQQDQFQRLYHQICEGNKTLNLTRITEPDEFWEKHLWDSLSGIQPFLQQNSNPVSQVDGETSISPLSKGGLRGVSDNVETDPPSPQPSSPKKYYVLDIGSGAGFPGLPVAIACPHCSITLLDSTRKKMAYVDSILADVGLNNVRTVTERAETLGHAPDHRQRYNLVVIRAVASAAACAEYAIPFLKLNGQAVLYRGRWAEYELMELKRALKILGGIVDDVRALSTPLTGGDRHCIVIRKISKTPKTFPRAVGIPAKTPLS